MYTEQNLVRVAKRENNSKRNYLVVNRLQGKHIPVRPGEALAMFCALADTVRGAYEGEKLLVIGFAETATAIGAAVAAELGADYMQTTREALSGVEYLYFSEEHSHATEQKLVRDDIDSAAGSIDRILFVEDEVTTGKTILNSIAVLKKQYSDNIKFSVASVLNGMDKAALDTYKDSGIELFWLVKTDHAAYARTAKAYRGDGTYIVCKNSRAPEDVSLCGIEHIKTDGHMNARRLVSSAAYQQYCAELCGSIAAQADIRFAHRVLVLGTEEYMYPALLAASRLEAQGKDVWFHATTRSPIAVSTEPDYPLHARYELSSLYDSGRTTYIYDLQKYDTVVIMTDAEGDLTAGVDALARALRLCGNERILLVGKRR